MKPAETKRIALCGVMAALSVVILLLGAVLGLGIYLAPVVAGLILVPVGRSYGAKSQIMLWLAVSVLAFLLVPDIEEKLMHALANTEKYNLWDKLKCPPQMAELGEAFLQDTQETT